MACDSEGKANIWSDLFCCKAVAAAPGVDSLDFNLRLNFYSQFKCWNDGSGPLPLSLGSLPQMPPSLSAHRARLPIGTLALLLGVFSWGLGYKISLYHHGKPARATANPPAKLLTEAERRIVPKGAITSPVLAAPVSVLSCHALAAEYRRERARSAVHPLLTVEGPAPGRRSKRRFFIRPPPLS